MRAAMLLIRRENKPIFYRRKHFSRVYSGRNYVALGNVNDVNPLPKEGRGGIKLKNIVVGFRTKYQTAGIHRFEKFPWRTIGSFPDS